MVWARAIVFLVMAVSIPGTGWLTPSALAGQYDNGVDGVTITSVAGSQYGPVNEINISNGIRNSTFSRNSATLAGGAVRISTRLSGGVWNSVFDGNTALDASQTSGRGGAMAVGDFLGGIHGSTFTNNLAGTGGAIYSSSFTGVITDSFFSGNRAVGGTMNDGGAISSTGMTGDIIRSEFTNNHAYGYGGAIYSPGYNGDIIQSLFADNTAASGGAMYIRIMRGAITDSVFRNNSAVNNGGAIVMDASNAGETISNSVFENNRAGNVGGAIFSSYLEDVTISGGRFANNTASVAGGAMFLSTENAYGGANSIMDLVLTAAEGKELVFTGNRDANGANSLYFGRFNGSNSQASATLTVTGAGRVQLLDPIRVDMTSVSATDPTFHFTRNTSRGNGDFVWGGYNSISTVGGSAHFTFDSGRTMVLSNFSLSAQTGTDLGVWFGSSHNLVLDLADREGNLAILDYTLGGSGSQLSWDQGTTLSIARSLLSSEGRYLLVDGYDHSGLNPDDIVFVNASNVKFELDASDPDKLWLVITRNPVDDPGSGGSGGGGGSANSGVARYRPNVRRSLYALDQLVRHTEYGLDMSDEEYRNFLNAIDTATPEVGVTMGLVNMQTHDMVIDQALRSAFAAPASAGFGFGGLGGEPVEPCDDPPAVQRDRAMAERNGLGMWAGYIGNFAKADTHSGYMGYDTQINGFLFGMGATFREVVTTGAYLGYSANRVKFDELRGNGKADAFHTGLYGRYSPIPELSFTLDGAFSYVDTAIERRTVGYSHHGDFNQYLYSVGFGMAYDICPWENGRIMPQAGARATWSRQDAFRETGGPLSAQVNKANTNSLVTTVGLVVAQDFILEDATVMSPYLRLAYKRENGDRYVKTRGNTYLETLVTGEAHLPFDTLSLPRDRDIFQAGVGVQWQLVARHDFELGLNAAYGVEVSSNYLSHEVYAGLNLSF